MISIARNAVITLVALVTFVVARSAESPTAAQWTATPSSITDVAAGTATPTSNPMQSLYQKMGVGHIADLSGGVYARPSFTKSPRVPGVYVTMRGPPWSSSARAKVLPNLASGGGDTINLGATVGDLRFVRCDVEADDRSAVLSVLHSVHRNVVFDNCKIHGTGSAYDANWKSDTKWLVLGNQDAEWQFIDVDFFSVFQEHVYYGHNNQDSLLFLRCTAKHAGRTFMQILSRKFDGPVGVGDFTIKDCRIEDMALESGGGGSYITCRGGFPNSTITIDGTVIRGGCDPLLAFHTASVTGAVVVDEEPGSNPGTISVHPGGLKAFVLRRDDIEFGLVHRGSGSAVRPILRFMGPLQSLLIEDVRCVVHRAPGYTPVALEIGPNVVSVKFRGTNDFVGECWYRGTHYKTLTAMLAANPALTQ